MLKFIAELVRLFFKSKSETSALTESDICNEYGVSQLSDIPRVKNFTLHIVHTAEGEFTITTGSGTKTYFKSSKLKKSMIGAVREILKDELANLIPETITFTVPDHVFSEKNKEQLNLRELNPRLFDIATLVVGEPSTVVLFEHRSPVVAPKTESKPKQVETVEPAKKKLGIVTYNRPKSTPAKTAPKKKAVVVETEKEEEVSFVELLETSIPVKTQPKQKVERKKSRSAISAVPRNRYKSTYNNTPVEIYTDASLKTYDGKWAATYALVAYKDGREIYRNAWKSKKKYDITTLELMALNEAIEFAYARNLTNVTVYHDVLLTNFRKNHANNQNAMDTYENLLSKFTRINETITSIRIKTSRLTSESGIRFKKVKAHSGVTGNENADDAATKLAAEILDSQLTSCQLQKRDQIYLMKNWDEIIGES